VPQAIALDIYGTLVDPLRIDEHLEPVVGERASELSGLWHQKQLEYTFRRALMGEYEDFGVCTRQALVFAARSFGVELSAAQISGLLEKYRNPPPFPDAARGLEALKAAGYTLVAFSNGLEDTARTLLRNAGLLEHLGKVISVDDMGSFKPDPEVYYYLARRLNRSEEEIWLVSSNAFDVIGARNAGLRAAWIKRSPEAVFDPWAIEPDLTVGDLEQLSSRL
jgi:2-haloacid dehalogenase